jgi:hypothetical protein
MKKYVPFYGVRVDYVRLILVFGTQDNIVRYWLRTPVWGRYCPENAQTAFWAHRFCYSCVLGVKRLDMSFIN